jgi:uncharacterized RDD family membrane protein YckC
MSALGKPIVLDFRNASGEAAARAVAPPRAARSTQPAPAPQAVRRAAVPASWLARGGALLIDGAVVGLISIVLGLLLMVLVAPILSSGGTGAMVFLLLVVTFLPFTLASVIVTIAYSVRLLSRPGALNGQTYGRQALRLRVMRDDGRPMDGGSAAMREVVWKLLVFGVGGSFLLFLPTLLDYLWPLWDDRGRTLHDKAAGTYVVRVG